MKMTLLKGLFMDKKMSIGRMGMMSHMKSALRYNFNSRQGSLSIVTKSFIFAMCSRPVKFFETVLSVKKFIMMSTKKKTSAKLRKIGCSPGGKRAVL